jgi:hypothetical protein
MLAKHLKEATDLVKELKVLNERLSALDTTDCLEIAFAKRQITVPKSDPQFIKLRAASKVFLDLRVSNIHRRMAQIGLHLEPVVS